MAQSTVEKVQTILGVEADGIWGPKSQAALNAEIGKTAGKANPTIQKIQKAIGADADGFWGPNSQGALDAALGRGGGGGNPLKGIKAQASSFADPADVAAFKKCKLTGKTDQQCFKVGDNGIGQFGANTAQTHTPMVAIHKDDMIAKWGNVSGAAHRLVTVAFKGKTVTASVEDRLGVAGRIDLNPAAAAALGLNPPIDPDKTTVVWAWV